MAVATSGFTTSRLGEVDANFLAAIISCRSFSRAGLGQVNYYTATGSPATGVTALSGNPAISALMNPSPAHIIIPLSYRTSYHEVSTALTAETEYILTLHICRDWLPATAALPTAASTITPMPMRANQPASITGIGTAVPSNLTLPRVSNLGANSSVLDAGAVFDPHPIAETHFKELLRTAAIGPSQQERDGIRYDLATVGTYPLVLQGGEALTCRAGFGTGSGTWRITAEMRWAEMPNELFDFYS